MSHSSTDHLVKMANQIADFFGAQKAADRADGVFTHIHKFWDPRMRAGIVKHLATGGGAGLNPIALEAVKRLAADSEKPPKA